MKFFIINSFRSMIYIAFFAIIGYAALFTYTNHEILEVEFGFSKQLAQPVSIVVGLLGGWIIASLICGLIVTLLDIRDDINDRLPDARED